MDLLSPWPALAATVLALLSAQLCARLPGRLAGAPPAAGRFATIDGLRGLLAFAVFLHHGAVWHGYLRSGRWQEPHSALYTHFGQTSVALFFMITGFLFFSKVLDARRRPLDWLALWVSRVLRLLPLYLLALALMLVVVLALTDWRWREPAGPTAKALLRWLSFSVLGMPDLNGVERTRGILAGVTWSLAYEWFFYLCLPLWAVAIGVRTPLLAVAVGLAAAWGLVQWQPDPMRLLPFAGGLAAALLVRAEVFRRASGHPLASLAVLGLVAATVWSSPTAYAPLPVALLSAAFALVAGGAGLFGLLRWRAAHALGEMAYSLYLLHGLLLFVLFRFVLGAERAAGLSVAGHWAALLAATPVLVLACHTSFRLVERPAMGGTAAVTAWLRGAATRLAGALTRRGA